MRGVDLSEQWLKGAVMPLRRTSAALHAVLVAILAADAAQWRPLAWEHLVNLVRNAITSKMEDSGYEPSGVTSDATGLPVRMGTAERPLPKEGPLYVRSHDPDMTLDIDTCRPTVIRTSSDTDGSDVGSSARPLTTRWRLR